MICLEVGEMNEKFTKRNSRVIGDRLSWEFRDEV